MTKYINKSVELLAITPNSEKLIENAGRTCYLSFEKAKKDSYKRFIPALIKMGHESVLEHACATFRIRQYSRAFTHQLVRHRLCSYSQQSQRYVSEDNFQYVVPPSIAKNKKALQIFNSCIKEGREGYRKLKALGINNEDARFLLPNAAATEIVMTANFRELRHIFKLRCDRKAQWEIRDVCLRMLRIMKSKAPAVFGDFVIDEKTSSAHSAL